MLNVERTRACVAMNCLACLAMAAASAARANDEQSSSKLQKPDHQQVTVGQQKASPSNQTTDERKQADQQIQQSVPADQRESHADSAHQAAQNNQSSHKQGAASLGVSITSDKDENGVLVVRILPNTAAQRMGLQRHDRIQSLNGEKVRSADDFITAISSMNPGDRVELQVTRDGKERTIRGELEGFSESVVATQGPNGNHEYRQFQSYIEPNQPNSRPAARNDTRDNREGTQASNEKPASSNDSRFSDLETRITRLEQRFEHAAQQIEDLITNNKQGQPASAQKAAAPNTVKK